MRARRILVPIDFSDPSRNALREADEIAARQDAELTLLYVHSPTEVAILDFTYVEPADKIAEVLTAATERLEGLANDLATEREKIKVRVETGPPVATILELSMGQELIVMSTHGRTGLEHFLMGSVAERVVQAAPCSVLIVKPR